MLLREFLYVDADKVRGLLAQVDEGVVEGSTESEQLQKLTGAGVKGFAEHSQRVETERSVQKSQADALFPTLESALESLGLLSDISSKLQDVSYWTEGSVQREYPPGSLVRITAPATLFDARYVASTLAAFATTWQGLVNVEAVTATKVPEPPLKKGQQGSQRSTKQHAPEAPTQLEDLIPKTDIRIGGDDGPSAEFLRGIVRVARGMYTPGLHFNMLPAEDDDCYVTARLQEGRRFLDTEPDVLFARYGAQTQEWTLVGAIGHYGIQVNEMEDDPGLVSEDSIRRARFLGYVNQLMSHMGTLGFVDLPQAPAFSVVPLAVYRLIGGTPDSAGESNPEGAVT